MESSEDDAGTATNASRRASAREKDVGVAEDGNATSSFQQEPSEARPSCETPAMSEDNFDGDSVPSPSAQDVNTSTEAILDMIDEIVDGPGAPKRLPLLSESDDTRFDELEITSEHSNIIQESTRNDHDSSPLPVVASPADSAKSELLHQSRIDSQAESSSLRDTQTDVLNTNTNSGETLPESSSLPEVDEPAVSTQPEDSALSNVVPATSASCPPPNIPSSSEEMTVQNISDISECKTQERTVKCVSSSDSRDNVTVESAESTSSDTSVSDGKAVLIEPQVRSPLRRRLIRPAPSDRRPDSTVSSTVDSQNVNITTTEQKSSDNITKDVTSSSDAVPTIHGNVKPEEISNVSEINICKAETSVSPPKKIKLIRQKVSTGTSNRDNSSNQSAIQSDKEQCQSTSPDNHSLPLPEPHTGTSSTINIPQSQDNNETSTSVNNCVSETLAINPEQALCSNEHSLPSIEPKQEVVEKLDETEQISVQINLCVPNSSEPELDVNTSNAVQESSSLPVTSSVELQSNVKVNDLEHDIISNIEQAEQNDMKEPESSQNIVVLPKEIVDASSVEISPSIVESCAANEKESTLSVEPCASSEEAGVVSVEPCASSEDAGVVCIEPCASSEDVNALSVEPNALSIEADAVRLEVCASSEEASGFNVEPCASNKEASTFVLEPSASSAANEEICASSEEANALSVLPCASSQEANALRVEPCASSQETNALSVGPYASSEEANALSLEPCASSQEVSASNEEPCVSSEEASTSIISTSENSDTDKSKEVPEDQKKVPPIKLNLCMSNLPETKLDTEHSSISKNNFNHEECEVTKQVPKLTIKLKQPDEVKQPIPKVTIKPIRPPTEQDSNDKTDKMQQVPCVTKINIKPILKPPDNEKTMRSQQAGDGDARTNTNEQLPSITKLNIKPILKPPEKINDIHRKSSSSEISESEYSENDETSTSDQASTSDQGPSDIIPKVTIKLGKPGTESEGKFYTEKNIPKLTIKGFQQEEKEESEPKLKMVISQSEDKQSEKIPKLTIKTVSKSESQPLSPNLTIKPLKPPDTKEGEIPKIKISTESFSSTAEVKESTHVPKITIKPVTRSTALCDSPEHIPVVTKLNIKPILKPTDSGESSEGFDDKVPVVSKLNIKPVIKPKDNDVASSVDDIPKVTKLNIKPIKNPEGNSSEEKDCDELNADNDENSIPVVTKINIKPIIKPHDEETLKDSENQSSETGNSSDDNGDHIPVVTKLNIKPILKPDTLQESSQTVSSSEPSIPVITKLNIKPLVKPGENISPSSPKKEHVKIDGHSSAIPVVTKLNIKPVMRPEESDLQKAKDDTGEKSVTKNPPLVMKINMKTMTENLYALHNEHICNNVSEEVLSMSPKTMKLANTIDTKSELCQDSKNIKRSCDTVVVALEKDQSSEEKPKTNCVPESVDKTVESDEKPPGTKTESSTATKEKYLQSENVAECDSLVTESLIPETTKEKELKPNEVNKSSTSCEHKNMNFGTPAETNMMQNINRPKFSSLQNCTLLKKLLENKSSLDVSPVVNYALPTEKVDKSIVNSDHLVESGKSSSDKTNSDLDKNEKRTMTPDKVNDSNKSIDSGMHSIQDLSDKASENVTKPLEITISDKITNQSSGQDSPRIILKINKTDHGPSAKIITEDVKRQETQQNYTENTQDILNDKQSPKKYANSRRKQTMDTSLNLSTGKRLRSSRIVENTEKTPVAKRNMGKRPSTTDVSPPQNKESDLSPLQTKRLKLGQLLSNKSLSITPVSKASPPSPTKTSLEMKQGVKTVNHSLLNNENCSKNGNSKLHNILSNLQAKQMQSLPFNNTNCSEKSSVDTDLELNASVGSSDAVEIAHVENSHPELQEMIINENSDYRDFGTTPEEVSQDPLEVKPAEEPPEIIDIPKPVELTPQPKKRGRPRKLPVSESAKPVTLPVPALEERPQRSLRLMRDRPTILLKPRGRARGRGGRRAEVSTPPTELETIVVIEPADEPEDRAAAGEIDPTSSRIKLPRMTEALDKMPSSCVTPLSSRRRNSSGNFSTGETPELKVMLENSKLDEFGKTPEPSGSGRGRGGRGSRGGRGRTPRGRGRGRGGGRGAMYMKETMGIYGRVCGPATTTVQLFEEETCMMDDNATPAKPSHLLDEDSQSSVKSSTNDSNKLKKSKFADLFDSNKVWTAADVKEYTWPPPDKADVEHKVMMIQEQVAMFLGVKSFKRRYPELKRRTITGEERDYVLSKGLVTEALCDLGITAVDASEVLDIMLSDYPHKYEEFRSHQRQRQLTETAEEPVEEAKTEEKVVKVEMKPEKPVEHKPELPKIDPEKTRQDMAAAAIASASEWNLRVNASRRGACVDLQSLTVQRPRPPLPAPERPHLKPPAGFYPHALLPAQYQHSYRLYTPEQLRYFPLNTVLAAPPAPASEDWSSESEPDWGSRFSSSDDSDAPTHHSAKRKKLTKTKRSSNTEVASSSKEESRTGEEVDLCRVCKMRLEANRRYTHERFLVCANCNAKLHPSCLELSADTIRKCREYAWQCAECKTCCSCRQPADDDKMLFCDLCDRGFHIYCVGLDTVPSGRWHCVECAICKSCGARSPGGSSGAVAGAAGAAPDWHHQTRRGPGGHKVYSHSLCTPCARAYRIGRYCPLCERSFIGPKGTMQLVICKLCDRQLHQDCVRQTVSSLNVLDYTCAECRRGGITSRAAAVRLAPRTIATLFMAKRRFNKYAHRQYMESRLREAEAASRDSCDELPDAPPLSVHAPRSDASDASDAHDATDAPDATDPLDPSTV